MDDAQTHSSVLAAEYRYLSVFNRVMATAGFLLDAIDRRVTPRDGTVSVVDIGTGGGDTPRELVRLSRGRAWKCSCLCTDSNPKSIEYARGLPPVQGLTFQVVDVLHAHEVLGVQSADVVHASLMHHHLDDAAVVESLRCMGKVARQLVVWNDLVRDRVGIVGAHLSTLFSRKELRRDAVVSVRRAFTLDEARMLAEAAGLCDIQVNRVRGARFVLTGRPGPGGQSDMRRPLVRVEDVSFSFGSRRVLTDVSFVVRSGQVLRVTGANGSGKSTLLACVAGVLAVRSGRVWLDRTYALPGYLPQEGGLFSALAAAENIALAARLSGVPRAEHEARVRAAIENLGVQNYRSTPVFQLSGGLRRRVAIACTIVHEPNVLILDEPDAALDAVGHAALGRAIERVVTSGGVALIASHSRDWSVGTNGDTECVEVAL